MLISHAGFAAVCFCEMPARRISGPGFPATARPISGAAPRRRVSSYDFVLRRIRPEIFLVDFVRPDSAARSRLLFKAGPGLMLAAGLLIRSQQAQYRRRRLLRSASGDHYVAGAINIPHTGLRLLPWRVVAHAWSAGTIAFDFAVGVYWRFASCRHSSIYRMPFRF